MITVRIIVSFLPNQMQFDDRPHLAHIGRISIILEMPEQLIDIIQVHVIMMHLVIPFRITTDIAIRIHLRTPFLFRTGQIHLRIL